MKSPRQILDTLLGTLRARWRPLTAKQRKIALFVAIPVGYLVSLVVFVRLTFPYDTLRDRLLAEFNKSQHERVLYIDEISGSGIFGIEAEGVTLEERSSGSEPAPEPDEAKEGAKSDDREDESAPAGGKTDAAKKGDAAGGASKKAKVARPPSVRIESLDLGISLLSYLFGRIDVDFEAVIGGGEIEGSYYQSDTVTRIDAESTDVDVSELTLLSKAIGLPLGGALSGTVKLELPERAMNKAVGAFDLTISDLTVGDGKAKVRDTIALPKLRAGDLKFEATVTDGRLDLKTFGTDGPDFEMKSDGKVRLRQPFDKSIADIDVSFRFKDAYKNKNDMTKSLFGTPGSKVPGLFDMDPTVRRAKDAQGFYSWRVTGLITSPSFRPDVAASTNSDSRAGMGAH